MDAPGITKTGTILDRIVARKIQEVATLKFKKISSRRKPLDFAAALRGEKVGLIAEIKHASPSKGVLIEPFDPVALGTQYAGNGAAAISVLTDREFFQGSIEDLKAVRANVGVPVLRKDFIINARQIVEAAQAGADAILLIVAILDDDMLEKLAKTAVMYGLTILVEVHDREEMKRALKLRKAHKANTVIGINNRDLHTFEVDLNVTKRLAAMVPADVTLVAESGIFTVEDVQAVAAAGVDAILVGESIVKSPDVGEQVRMLSSVPRQRRS
jgi:indole-3-glycerol phosphate synthase